MWTGDDGSWTLRASESWGSTIEINQTFNDALGQFPIKEAAAVDLFKNVVRHLVEL
jgi:hypothetical protein